MKVPPPVRRDLFPAGFRYDDAVLGIGTRILTNRVAHQGGKPALKSLEVMAYTRWNHQRVRVQSAAVLALRTDRGIEPVTSEDSHELLLSLTARVCGLAG